VLGAAGRGACKVEMPGDYRTDMSPDPTSASGTHPVLVTGATAVVEAFGDEIEPVVLDFTDPGTWDAAYSPTMSAPSWAGHPSLRRSSPVESPGPGPLASSGTELRRRGIPAGPPG